MDEAALQDLTTSIARAGLRQPIEVFALADPEPPFLYGLISGLRRFSAHMDLSRGRDTGSFTTIAASRKKRSRLRLYAEVVSQLFGTLSTPEHLTARQMQRLSTALRDGLSDLLHATLETLHKDSLATQWEALTPILAEALTMDTTTQAPGRPRRLLHLKQGLTIRREMSGNGWILRFSGPEALNGALIDDVLHHVERLFQPK